MAGYAREELSFAAHAACGNAERRRRAEAQSGGAEGCITQERQRQCAASHKSVVHWQSRIAHAKITHDAGSRKEKGPNSLKFVRGETYHILVSEPLAASAGARAAAPSAPRLFQLRLCNKRENATGHQQGKRLLRIKFGFWANLLHFHQRACDNYHSRHSVCSDWTDLVVLEVERDELGLLVALNGLADCAYTLILEFVVRQIQGRQRAISSECWS